MQVFTRKEKGEIHPLRFARPTLSQGDKVSGEQKGERRNQKGDLRSLMSSRLRLMVPCTEIYHHSAGAVLALVIVRSLWIPRA